MKRLLAIVLMLFLVCGAAASGEERLPEEVLYAKTVAPNGGSVNLYRLPGEYRPVVTSFADGTTLIVLFQGSSWHKVSSINGDQVGWVKASELKLGTRGISAVNYGGALGAAKYIQSSDGYAALRWGPGFEYDIMENLSAGSVCWQFEKSGDWVRVITGTGHIGYVYSTLLRNTTASFPGGLYGYVQVAGNSAIYRQTASYSGKALGTLPSGEIVEILGESGEFWYFYSASRNLYAYIAKDIVSPEGINRVRTATTLYYDNPYRYMTDVLWDLPSGQVVKVLATDGYISRVQYEDIIGYVVSSTLAINH